MLVLEPVKNQMKRGLVSSAAYSLGLSHVCAQCTRVMGDMGRAKTHGGSHDTSGAVTRQRCIQIASRKRGLTGDEKSGVDDKHILDYSSGFTAVLEKIAYNPRTCWHHRLRGALSSRQGVTAHHRGVQVHPHHDLHEQEFLPNSAENTDA